MGAASRHWDKPTVPADQLQLLGSEWKSFEIGLTKCTTVKKLPPRFSALTDSVILTITYLQKMVQQNWCDYILNLGMLPSRCQGDIRIELPCWCSEQSFQNLIKTIKKQKKTVNVESKNDPKLTKKDVNDLYVSVDNELVPLSTLIDEISLNQSSAQQIVGSVAQGREYDGSSPRQGQDYNRHSTREDGEFGGLSAKEGHRFGGSSTRAGGVYGGPTSGGAAFRRPPPPA